MKVFLHEDVDCCILMNYGKGVFETLDEAEGLKLVAEDFVRGLRMRLHGHLSVNHVNSHVHVDWKGHGRTAVVPNSYTDFLEGDKDAGCLDGMRVVP